MDPETRAIVGALATWGTVALGWALGGLVLGPMALDPVSAGMLAAAGYLVGYATS